MEIQRLTLPLLLDLTSVPSYPNSKSTAQKKSQSKTQSVPGSVRSRDASKPPDSSKESQEKPGTSQRRKVVSRPDRKLKGGKDARYLYYNDSKSPGKPLPLLYSGPQYTLMTQKASNLREKYQKLYNNSKPEGEQVEALEGEDLKEIMKEAEKMFNETYSVKYFGVKNDELGIISKRVPMEHPDNRKSGGGKDLDYSLAGVDREGLQKQRTQSINAFFQTPNPSNWLKERTAEEGGNPAETMPTARSDFIVTKYFAPKKLEALRRVDSEQSAKTKSLSQSRKLRKNVQGRIQDIHSRGNSDQGNNDYDENLLGDLNRIWQNVKPVSQRDANTADFERKLVSVERAKRTLLRNVHVDKVWDAKTVKDELDVPEQFRTHEVRNVMAKSAKYSYSKLLNTIYSVERPETVLIENTEKMEKILALREERKNQAVTAQGNEDPNARNLVGKYIVQVQYPKENEMFNRFVKIRNTMESREK